MKCIHGKEAEIEKCEECYNDIRLIKSLQTQLGVTYIDNDVDYIIVEEAA